MTAYSCLRRCLGSGLNEPERWRIKFFLRPVRFWRVPPNKEKPLRGRRKAAMNCRTPKSAARPPEAAWPCHVEQRNKQRRADDRADDWKGVAAHSDRRAAFSHQSKARRLARSLAD